jgi:hypothetical protein
MLELDRDSKDRGEAAEEHKTDKRIGSVLIPDLTHKASQGTSQLKLRKKLNMGIRGKPDA